MSAQLFTRLRGKISRRNVEYRFAAVATLSRKTNNGTSIASQHASSELGVGLKIKRIFNLAVLVTSGFASTDNHAPMRQASMIRDQALPG